MQEHELMWRQLLRLDRNAAASLQIQLRSTLANAVLDGRLPDGLKLPSSRDLARVLGISRNTVSLVYERLVSEGHITSRAREGHFVHGGIRRVEVAKVADSGDKPARPNWNVHFAPASINRWLNRPAGWQSIGIHSFMASSIHVYFH